METESAKILWDKLNQASKGVKEKMRIAGENILDQYELQDISPHSPQAPIAVIQEEHLVDIFPKPRDAEIMISKINSFSSTPVIKYTYTEFTNSFFLNLNNPALLKEIIDHLSKAKIEKAVSNTELKVGPLSYKQDFIYYKNALIENFTPQMVKACALFMERTEEFISYETIQEEISTIGYVAKGNMQKIVSDVRTALRSKTGKNLIRNQGGKGYIFDGKEIL